VKSFRAVCVVRSRVCVVTAGEGVGRDDEMDEMDEMDGTRDHDDLRPMSPPVITASPMQTRTSKK
jgi:hypothetical protein